MSIALSETVYETDSGMGTIVSGYLAGRRELFEDIRRHLRPVVCSVLFSGRFQYHRNCKDDLEQECWLTILQKLPQWDPTRGPLKRFIYICLANRLTSHFRKRDNDQRYLPIENMERYVPYTDMESSSPDDLVIDIRTRLCGFVVDYVIRRIAIALYLEVFDQSRKILIRELAVMAAVPVPTMRFLVDYATVIVKRDVREGS